MTGLGYAQTEIAEIVGVTRQRVSAQYLNLCRKLRIQVDKGEL